MKRVNALMAVLAISCLITACTSLVTNKGQALVKNHFLVPDNWPNTENNSAATLVVVNPYEKRCCGPTASYSVTIRDRLENEIFKNNDLLPIDDFFCVSLRPGFYSLELKSGNASHYMKLEARAEGYYYVAADVRLIDPLEVLLYSMNKAEAMQYVNRAAYRIVPAGGDSGRDLRLKAKLNCHK